MHRGTTSLLGSTDPPTLLPERGQKTGKVWGRAPRCWLDVSQLRAGCRMTTVTYFLTARIWHEPGNQHKITHSPMDLPSKSLLLQASLHMASFLDEDKLPMKQYCRITLGSLISSFGFSPSGLTNQPVQTNTTLPICPG